MPDRPSATGVPPVQRGEGAQTEEPPEPFERPDASISHGHERLPRCSELVELVTDYLDDCLSTADREQAELHLVVCGACQTYLEQMRTTIRLMGMLGGGGTRTVPDGNSPGQALGGLSGGGAPRLYKFLAEDRTTVLSGFQWPVGRWVEEARPVALTRNGVHACRPGDLPYWLGDALWTVQLDGPILEGERSVVAPRGRLVDRVTAWDGQLASEFVRACRAREQSPPAPEARLRLGPADPADGWVPHAGAAYIAAHSAGLASIADGGSYEDGARSERVWQAWLAEHLGLPRTGP